jgi:zinc/manganese transport system substrate-binding protein/manganese/iron transport system substrate-binding protein
MRRMKAAFLAALLLVAACGGQQPGPSGQDGRIQVVTTTSVLADFVSRVGGERVRVSALVPTGGEVHTFDPAPSDAARLESADLLVMNGLGLDDWLLDFAQQAGAAETPVIQLAVGLIEVDYIDDNPHLWLDPAYASIYVDLVRLKLIELDAGEQADYDANADAYDDQLVGLDEWARGEFDALPKENRRIVSFHDAFPYFARAYGLEIVGVVVEAPGQEPSAREVAALIDAIRRSGARAILAEEQFSDELARTIADETDADLVSDLYTDSLGDAPLDSYDAIMRWDVQRIVEALR